MQVTQFYKMHGIFNTKNMRAVGEFRGLILVAHQLTPACKGSSLTNHRFSCYTIFLSLLYTLQLRGQALNCHIFAMESS